MANNLSPLDQFISYVAGFGNFLAGATVMGAIVTLGTIILNSRGPLRKLKMEADQQFSDKLIKRIEKLEEDNEAMQEKHDLRIKEYETKIETLQMSYEQRINSMVIDSQRREAAMRHQLQNTRACFNALIFLLKRMPDPQGSLAGIMADIEEMRREQLRGESLDRLTDPLPKLPPANDSLIATPIE